MVDVLERKYFRDIPIDDPFFDSLKKDYQEFVIWFQDKATQPAYVQYTGKKLTGFMYLKYEEGEVDDIIPPLPFARRIKIGSLKVEAHGTRLGERLIKKAIDHAIIQNADEIYLTVFPHHKTLIKMLEEFGFKKIINVKKTPNGTEKVLVKNFDHQALSGNLRKDFPMIDTRKANFFLLAIQPQWHSQLFPDSILKTERYDLLSDITHTNSISKNYVCSMEDVDKLKPHDLLVIYRMSDNQGPAEYRSVATSICAVEEVRSKYDFTSLNDYLTFTQQYSVFNEQELRNWWNRRTLYVIKMLYNAAFTKRLIRKDLAEKIGLDRKERWGFLQLSREQFLKIVNFGGVYVRLVVR